MARDKNNDKKWIGQKFGRLTIIGFSKAKGKTGWRWDCKCECGKTVYSIKPQHIKCGQTRSCGCLKSEQDHINIVGKNKTHGKSDSRLFRIWALMKSRCDNPHCPAYKNYGGRGIKVCNEWHDNFQSFYDWAMSHGYTDELTIERIDNDKGYSPDNCCWITREEQARNKRNIRYVELDGERIPLKTACKRLGLPYKAIHLRVTRYGMSIEDALSKPFVDKSQSLAAKCRERGLPYGTIQYRILAGWDEDRAFNEPINHPKQKKGA